MARCMVSLEDFNQGILRKSNDLDTKKADVLYNMQKFTEKDQSQHSILCCIEDCERKNNLE